MNLTSEAFQCPLPEIVGQIVNASTSFYSMRIPRELMEGYFDCHSFARLLLHADWQNQLREFPALIGFLCTSIIMTVLGLTWFIYECVHQKTYRAENLFERYLRLALSITIFFLVLPYIFFLWLAFESYSSTETIHNGTTDANAENLRLSGFFEKYIPPLQVEPLSAQHLDHIRNEVKNFSKHLAAQAEIVAPKVIQKGERSILGKLSVKSIDLMPLIQKMQTELHNLIADVMQLSDHTRFFYRNTTALLDLQYVNFNDYSTLLFNEFEANEQQIVMLLNINNTLVKLMELVFFASTLNDMRENLTTNMYTEFDILGKDLNATVTRKTLEYTALDEKKLAQLARLHHGTSTNPDFFLSPNLSHLEAVYSIVATLILALLFVYLGDFVIGSRNRTVTRYLLMSNENENFCNLTEFHYCSLHNQVRSIGHAQDKLRLSLTSYAIKDFCSHIYYYNNKPETQQWTQELNQQLPFFEQIYRSGAMFEVARQELNLENWYELYNTLYNYNIAESNPEHSNTQHKMLACNLHTIRDYIFEQLFKRNIAASILKLTQQSGNLRTHLPGNNLTRLIKRVLREAQELSDFCHTLENLLQEKIENISELLARELMSQVAPLFEQFPRCEDLRFASLGISREMYECIECSLHGFHIGAFGILIILFIVLLFCICLVMLYEKQAAIGVIRSSSLLGMRSREYAASDNSPGSWANQADSGGRRIFIKRPTRVRFIEPPKIKRRRRR
ncbi:uncharacterized protein LOC120771855 isoform X2 [Bactrocera tryoni]|uniref:uncharacterized protein LOC120771855 isoform X2 n=1 Tax=Bactrocera tryoni TaxID=59916 RepID=UPI001A95F394|nr:uncharacterized protein LOC120771855 isoform X2 [Bactrocera tryoni]